MASGQVGTLLFSGICERASKQVKRVCLVGNARRTGTFPNGEKDCESRVPDLHGLRGIDRTRKRQLHVPSKQTQEESEQIYVGSELFDRLGRQPIVRSHILYKLLKRSRPHDQQTLTPPPLHTFFHTSLPSQTQHATLTTKTHAHEVPTLPPPPPTAHPKQTWPRHKHKRPIHINEHPPETYCCCWASLMRR